MLFSAGSENETAVPYETLNKEAEAVPIGCEGLVRAGHYRQGSQSRSVGGAHDRPTHVLSCEWSAVRNGVPRGDSKLARRRHAGTQDMVVW